MSYDLIAKSGPEAQVELAATLKALLIANQSFIENQVLRVFNNSFERNNSIIAIKDTDTNLLEQVLFVSHNPISNDMYQVEAYVIVRKDSEVPIRIDTINALCSECSRTYIGREGAANQRNVLIKFHVNTDKHWELLRALSFSRLKQFTVEETSEAKEDAMTVISKINYTL